MNISSKLLLSLSVALLSSTASYAQSLDLVGVTLGMSPAEAEAALVSKEYIPTAPRVSNSYKKTGPTFAQRVLQAEGQYISGADEGGLSKTHFAKGDNFREWVEIYFTEMPAGAFVTSIKYTFTDSSVSKPEFNEKVTSKYGTPSSTHHSGLYWRPQKTFKIDSVETSETLEYDTRSSTMQLVLTGKFTNANYLKMIQDARPKGKVDTTF